jgi:UDP-N-acetylmuramoylalanine--D-glutamate ligase
VKKPTLLGYGLTTRAIAERLGGGCVFFDDNCEAPRIDENANRIYPSSFFKPDEHPLVLTTPSVPPEHPVLRSARFVLSEYDYFLSDAWHRDAPDFAPPVEKKPFTVWISGTNGKTTTTQMLTHLLADKGAQSGGNIGTPLAKLDENAPIWVLETSSFTMHHTRYASPDIYLLLPVTPDHLDWHGDEEAYVKDKLRPLRTMKEGELALVPAGLPLPQTDAWVVTYETNEDLARFFHIDRSRIHFKGAFLQDALLALAVTRTLFDRVDYERINAFRKEAHRQEELYDTQGRLWVNDSKATNVDAVLQAVKTYGEKPIHLIIGGEDKGVDMRPLLQALEAYDLTLYTIGKNARTLADIAETLEIPVYVCDTIAEAVRTVARIRNADDVALLSPAAASFDQFSSYKERGDAFKREVKKL